MYIQQKSCQNVIFLIMSEKTILGGAKKCAIPHIFCAISHTSHGGNS